VKPGDTLYTVLEHVSRSGMMREIKVYAISEKEPVWLTGYAAKALGETLGKRDGIRMGGCGMDMGFSLVYNLSRTLYPSGFDCIKPEKCPSNDHSNHGDRDNTHHADGGYALSQRWL
jgi:hypothetical protein